MTDDSAASAPSSGRESASEPDLDPSVADTPADTHAGSQELALPDTILNPVTGELVPTSSVRDVGLNIAVLRRAKDQLDGVIAQFTAAAAWHSRVLGIRTIAVDEVKLTLTADTEVEWDIERLGRVLADVGCPQPRIDKLIKSTVTYTVDRAVASQLSAANPEYKRVIDECQRRIPKRQYAKVEVL